MSGNAVTILSDSAMAAQDIDPSEAESDLAVAEEALALDADDVDAGDAKKWAETRIQVAASS